MAGDWIKLHRQAIESRVFTDPFLWQLFSWCLIKANWKAGFFKGTPIPRGSFATGRQAAADALNVSESKFRRGIKRLETLGCISSKATNRFTVIRVEKYEQFQASSESSDHQLTGQTTIQRPSIDRTTDHNRRKKEGNKETSGGESTRFVPPTVDQVRDYVAAYAAEQRAEGKTWPIGEFDANAFHDHYQSNGWRQSNSNPIKDWEAAARGWGRRTFGGDVNNNGQDSARRL